MSTDGTLAGAPALCQCEMCVAHREYRAPAVSAPDLAPLRDMQRTAKLCGLLAQSLRRHIRALGEQMDTATRPAWRAWRTEIARIGLDMGKLEYQLQQVQAWVQLLMDEAAQD